MALTVEDGTGLDDANALASSVDVGAFLDDRGYSAFSALTPPQKDAAIVQATDFLSAAYNWKGTALSETQALGLPTDEVPAGDELPTPILAAVSRIALAIGVNAVNMYQTVGAKDLVKSVKAGSVAVEFADSSAQLASLGRPDFPWLADLLAPYVEDVTSPISRKVVRT